METSPPPLFAHTQRIRFTLEGEVGQELFDRAALPPAAGGAPNGDAVRRELLARAVRLTETMAPAAIEAAHAVRDRFGLKTPVEVFQSAGGENAWIHLVREPILLEVQGRFLSLLDRGSLHALMGHELGHFIAHGPDSGTTAVGQVTRAILADPSPDDELFELASACSMAREVTADRFAVLATGSLDDLLRLGMVTTTGLPAEALRSDTEGYLGQCRELVEACLRDGDSVRGVSHPEHGVRVWAAWLFSETDLFRELTGRGPGTRSIDDVNALVGRVLRRGSVSTVARDGAEVTVEVHELALASAVLIAGADGVLGDEEAEILEKTFSSLVPDWRRLLDQEVAAARLRELAPLALAAGPSLQQSLFNLLLHVLCADGMADHREFAAIGDIGRALGCEPFFNFLLRGTMRRIAVDSREERARAPLPVKPMEAAEALGALLQSVHQRGTLSISPRRLLRLLGAATPDEAARARLSKAVADADLTAEPAIIAAPLDQVLTLRSTRAKSTPPPLPRPDAGQLLRALQRLRDELISGDGHSPSIRLRAIRSGHSFDVVSLEAVSVGQAERVLALIAAGKSAALLSGEAIGRSDAAERLLRALVELRRESLARIEETGARDLQLGTHFVCGAVDGYVVRGPLVLQAVAIERASADAGVRVTPVDSEPPVANQALLRTLFHKAGLPFRDTDADRCDEMAGSGPEGGAALVEHLRSAGFDLFAVSPDLTPLDPLPEAVAEWKGRRLELQACAVLGFFPQSNSELLEDYDQLIGEIQAGRDPSELFASASALLPQSGPMDETVAAWKEPDVAVVPAIPADPSQVEVLATARRTRALVVDGPPGTGKSQVIANLVADCLARGERVAVVSEKRAALDVVANRLTAAGVGEALAVVHDAHEDRKALYRRIHARLVKAGAPSDTPAATASEPTAVPTRSIPPQRIEAAAALRAPISLLRRVDADGLPLGRLACLAAALPVRIPDTMPELGQLSYADASSLAEVAAEAAGLAALLTAEGPWRPVEGGPNRVDFSGSRAEDVAAVATALDAAASLQRLSAKHRDDGRDPQAAFAALAAVDAALSAVSALVSAPSAIWPILEAASAEQLAGLRQLRADWAAARELFVRFPSGISQTAPVDLEPLAVRLAASSGSWLRLISPSWWSGCSKLREHLVRFWPERMGAQLDTALLLDVAGRAQCAALWARLRAVAGDGGLRNAFPDDAVGVAMLLEAVSNHADHALSLLPHREALKGLGAWRLNEPTAWLAQLGALREAGLVWGRWVEAVVPCARAFHWVDTSCKATDLDALRAWIERDAERIPVLDRLLARADAITPGGARAIAACADAEPNSAWSAVIRRAWALRRIARLRGSEQVLSGDEVDRASARLTELLAEEARARRQAVASLVCATPLLTETSAARSARRTPRQAARERLLKETAKQRMLLPLRTFVREHLPHGLFDVVPVWLLSPETLAVLFPREPVFDVVIFDEASQCTVAGGFPALLRARRVVIAGDDRQMPPTSFFKAQRDDEVEETPAAETGRDVFDAESLLTLARQRFPARRLLWHYRCREEELIAFSNHAMYEGELLTCPSRTTPAAPPALRWVAVANAVYDGGRNETEAARVVDVLQELLSRATAPSVGVVTFNLAQRRAVLDAIDARRLADAEFARVYMAAETRELVDDRPFVKNLESVQGDERDIIIFSLGHAPVQRKNSRRPDDWYVPARFGPLGQRGGERRLNVAVSRARAEIVVVASFRPDQLSVARAKNDGPRLFRAYLDFAHHLAQGSRVLAHRVLDQVRAAPTTMRRLQADVDLPGATPLVGQIAEELLARQVPLSIRVGASRFQLDVALEEPGRKTRFHVAILCDDGEGDDGAYRLSQRAALLRSRGWRVLHVNALEWLERRELVLHRIETALRLPVATG